MSKGEETRRAILDHAGAEAARLGLEGLSIGNLARDLGMSKSGLFAHFSSKEALQLAILDTTADAFVEDVVRPALRAPRGLPRLQALFDTWLRWFLARRDKGGCLFVAATAEFDDRPGPVRDRLIAQQRDWLELIASVVQSAIRDGLLRPDLDAQGFAFELNGIYLSLHEYCRLMGDDRAIPLAQGAYQRMLRDAASAA